MSLIRHLRTPSAGNFDPTHRISMDGDIINPRTATSKGDSHATNGKRNRPPY